MPKELIASLDEVMSRRQFSVHRTAGGQEALFKIAKAPASWNPDKRSAKFVMTAEVEDRYGDVVVTKGADTAEFVKNPVVLWAHNARGFPIGTWSDLEIMPKRMEGVANLLEEETIAEADTAAKLIAQGALRACSIGFMPKKWESIKDDKDRWTGYRFLEWELLECSICSVPANPKAIVKSAGEDERLALQAIELVLDEWARTPDGLIVPREEYEKAYAFTKNKDVSVHEVQSVEEPTTKTAPSASTSPLEVAIESAVVRVLKGFAETFGLKPKAAEAVEEEADPVIEEIERSDAKAAADKEAREAEERAAAEAAAEQERLAQLADEDEQAELELRARQAALEDA